MSKKGEFLFPLDDDFKRLFILALEKYQSEIESKLVVQKSQLMVALYVEEKGLIKRALRKMNPINKDLLPTIVASEQLETETRGDLE